MPPFDTPALNVMFEESIPAVPSEFAPLSYAPITDLALRQHTLRESGALTGIGVHTGAQVSLRLVPAPADTGIVFLRTDLKNGARLIPARWDRVTDTKLCTVIGNGEGGLVATIEHLMAAINATGLDNAIVELDGPEVPVMDGSAKAFVELIAQTGLQVQTAPRREIVVTKPVEVHGNGKMVRLEPCEKTAFSFTIDFRQQIISKQQRDIVLTLDEFRDEIAPARTFGFFEEIEQMRALGFGRGGSLENAVVIKGEEVLNEGGLRYADEFVRHKILDAVGDMALAGMKIRGRFIGNCSGHAMNNEVLRALFADPQAWRLSTPPTTDRSGLKATIDSTP